MPEILNIHHYQPVTISHHVSEKSWYCFMCNTHLKNMQQAVGEMESELAHNGHCQRFSNLHQSEHLKHNYYWKCYQNLKAQWQLTLAETSWLGPPHNLQRSSHTAPCRSAGLMRNGTQKAITANLPKCGLRKVKSDDSVEHDWFQTPLQTAIWSNISREEKLILWAVLRDHPCLNPAGLLILHSQTST